jgi:hypothetical protein
LHHIRCPKCKNCCRTCDFIYRCDSNFHYVDILCSSLVCNWRGYICKKSIFANDCDAKGNRIYFLVLPFRTPLDHCFLPFSRSVYHCCLHLYVVLFWIRTRNVRLSIRCKRLQSLQMGHLVPLRIHSFWIILYRSSLNDQNYFRVHNLSI